MYVTVWVPVCFKACMKKVLASELEEYGLKLQTQVLIPIQYNEIVFDAGFRSDIFVEDQIIVEVKSVSEVQDAEHKQLITYLKLADKRLEYSTSIPSELIKVFSGKHTDLIFSKQ